jgi:hypothetical protein
VHKLSAGLGIVATHMLFAGLAYAEQRCYGTIQAVTPTTVFLSTPQGLLSAPLSTVSFDINGVRVHLAAVEPGVVVGAQAPEFRAVSAVPAHYTWKPLPRPTETVTSLMLLQHSTKGRKTRGN